MLSPACIEQLAALPLSRLWFGSSARGTVTALPKSLEGIDFCGRGVLREPAVWQAMAQLSLLTELSFPSSEADAFVGMLAASPPPALQRLEVTGPVSADELSALASATRLRRLVLQHHCYDDNHAQRLAGLPLTELGIAASDKISRAFLDCLAGMKLTLLGLNLEQSPWVGVGPLTRFSSVTTLRSLSLVTKEPIGAEWLRKALRMPKGRLELHLFNAQRAKNEKKRS